MAPAGRPSVIPKAKYMTLGPKFFCVSKMAVARRRSKLWWRTAHQSKALNASDLSSLSKRDLKHSGSFFFQKFACDLGFAAYEICCPKGPCGTTFRLKIQLYPLKSPLRDAFLAQNTILSAQKAPAGRFPDLRNIKKYVSRYLFRLWYMQSEAFPYNKSF